MRAVAAIALLLATSEAEAGPELIRGFEPIAENRPNHVRAARATPFGWILADRNDGLWFTNGTTGSRWRPRATDSR